MREKIFNNLFERSLKIVTGLFLLIGSFISTSVVVQNTNSVEGDREALMDLYEATGGDGWSNNNGWGSGDPPGSWHGVEVNTDGRVVRLDLPDNNLTGELPESIGNLQKLQYLNIKQNSLTGEIPSSIETWSDIKWLLFSGRHAEPPREDPQRAQHPGKSDDSGNEFSGVFPDVWSNFNNLKYFELSGSSLTHIFHSSIGEATALLQIHVSWNTDLDQQLPSALNNLTNLQKLYLRSNALTGGLPSLSNLTDLRFLHLGNGNALTGELPDFSNNTMLRSIILDKNNFSGDWPHYWNNGDFTNLITLRAAWNDFSGTLHGFEDLNLRTFVVNANEIEGTIPSSVTSNTELILFGVGWNKMTGQIPQDGWGVHSNTRYLRFSGNNLEGTIPDKLPNSSDLQYLYFEGNNLSGELPTNHGKYADSGEYPDFEYINISNNSFSQSDYQSLLDELGSSKLKK